MPIHQRAGDAPLPGQPLRSRTVPRRADDPGRAGGGDVGGPDGDARQRAARHENLAVRVHGELETALQDQTLTAPHRAQLESELDEVQRLAKIVDGLTLLTKADAGQVALAREPIRLDELVREAFADTQSLARPHGIQVSLTACEELTVTGDRHRLRQLLLNLTDNAVKYSNPQGIVTLNLRRAGQGAEVTIANTGKGIPADLLPRIFDPFFRADASHSQAVEGCGLGLSIARWIVSAHGGTIEVASGPSRPTTATVQLPLAGEPRR